MIAPIIAKINVSLGGVAEIANVYDYGVSKIEGYPAIVWTPVEFTNDYLTNEQNFIGYTFNIQILAEVEIKGKRSSLHDVLIPAHDAVMAQLAKDWSFGQDANGNTIWGKATSGGFGIKDSQDGLLWVADIQLTVNQSININ